MVHNEKCRAMHVGDWLIDPTWLQAAITQIRVSGLHEIKARMDDDGNASFAHTRSGTAIFALNGPMMKGDSKFGGTNTLRLRRQIREASDASHIQRGLLLVDSPGGSVAGTADLADEIRRFGKSKPITAHVEDLGASAAYWAMSQASRITANRTAQIGSIGVVAVIEDTSKAADLSGVKVHVIASGEHKAPFVDGVPVTDAALATAKRRVMEIHRHFVADVQKGRRWTAEQADRIADGRVFIASEAMSLGLIDGIGDLDTHLAEIEGPELKAKGENRKARAEHILKLCS